MKTRILIIFVLFAAAFVIPGTSFAQNIGDDADKLWLSACQIGTSTDCDQSGLFHDAVAAPFSQSDSVAIGTVIQKDSMGENSIVYSISVDFYLKNYQPFDLLTAILNDTPPELQKFPEVWYYNSPVFNEGDLVFVYLAKNDGSYELLPESFALDKQESRGPPPSIHLTESPPEGTFLQGEKILVSGDVRKMELVKAAKNGERLDVELTLHRPYDESEVFFSDLIDIDADGHYRYHLDTSDIPPAEYHLKVKYGPSSSSTDIAIDFNSKYWSPLKQFKSGVPDDEIRCRESLILVVKHDSTPACVKEQSIPKLIERGWAERYTNIVTNNDYHILKYSPVLFNGTGIMADKDNLSLEDLQKLEQRKLELEKLLDSTSLDEKTYEELSDERFMIQLHAKDAFDGEVSWELVRILWEKYKKVGESMDNFDRSVFPIVSLRGLSIGSNAYTVDEEYSGKPTAISVGILKNQFTKQTLEKTDQMLRELVGDEMDILYHKSGYGALNQTEQLWKSTEDWNSLRLIRSDDGLYCSPNVESSDHCYSLEEIVFGNGHKRSEHGWKVYPGAGIILPENSTLVPIYKTSALGMSQIDLNAMLDDKTFVEKCESNGGTWNYDFHDCEGLWQVCKDVGGIYLNDDVTPFCDPLSGCNASKLIRVSCVFEYEN